MLVFFASRNISDVIGCGLNIQWEWKSFEHCRCLTWTFTFSDNDWLHFCSEHCRGFLSAWKRAGWMKRNGTTQEGCEEEKPNERMKGGKVIWVWVWESGESWLITDNYSFLLKIELGTPLTVFSKSSSFAPSRYTEK